MSTRGLQPEDWDFASLPKDELVPALCWEILRESPGVAEIVRTGQAWLDGKLSTKSCPPAKNKRGTQARHHFPEFSEADIAAMRACAVFQHFIPSREFRFPSKAGIKERRKIYNQWKAKQLRPLIANYGVPWLCLPPSERRRLSLIIENSRHTATVHIPEWSDAIHHYEKSKVDGGQPLVFSCDILSPKTTILLQIEWRFTRRRIMTAINKILDQYEPQGMKPTPSRGHKLSDRLASLERLGMMRLLHHYRLAEIPLKVPEAWKRYGTRKWYEERKRALKNFRDLRNRSDKDQFFPLSWETRTQRARRKSQLPTK